MSLPRPEPPPGSFSHAFKRRDDGAGSGEDYLTEDLGLGIDLPDHFVGERTPEIPFNH